MQVLTRRLIVVGTIALFGAAAGLTLGQFVAGPEAIGNHGTNEASSLDAGFMAEVDNGADQQGYVAQSGPSSYNCQGCDAHLHDDMIAGDDVAPADVTPLPPYRSEDAPVAPLVGAGASVRRDVPGGNPGLPGLTAPTLVVPQPESPKPDQPPALWED
jgi:hypothetical protein